MRADRLLVERGFFESRARAQAAIAAGLVSADGRRVRKASDELAEDAMIEAAPEHPYVSRGALKLAAALAHFGFDPKGQVCLDIGASTGGFSEVLLERGARLVYAVDVGARQLHPRLRAHPRIVSLEATDIRKLAPAQLGEPPTFFTIDVSFISLKHVLPKVTELLVTKDSSPPPERGRSAAKPPGGGQGIGQKHHASLDPLPNPPPCRGREQPLLIALIKPQFEAGRARLKKGVVRDEAVHRAVCEDIVAFAASLGWRVEGVIPSPIAGGEGNREFLMGARRG